MERALIPAEDSVVVVADTIAIVEEAATVAAAPMVVGSWIVEIVPHVAMLSASTAKALDTSLRTALSVIHSIKAARENYRGGSGGPSRSYNDRSGDRDRDRPRRRSRSGSSSGGERRRRDNARTEY